MKHKLVLWSIAAFLVPLGFAVHFGMWSSALILLAVIATSFLYHRSGETKFLKLDSLLAWLLIISNLRLCYLGGFALPYFACALATAALALAFYYKEGRGAKDHAIWHILSALVTIFSILTFAL